MGGATGTGGAAAADEDMGGARARAHARRRACALRRSAGESRRRARAPRAARTPARTQPPRAASQRYARASFMYAPRPRPSPVFAPLPNPWGARAQPARMADAARGGRLREFFGTVPIVTLSVFLLCVGIFVADNTVVDFGAALAACAMSPAAVIGDLQLYRIVTAAFTHGSILHVGMNMLSFLSLGASLEALCGSLGFAFLLSVYTLLAGGGFLALGALASAADRSYWWQSAVGLSGVIFALAVDECALSPAPTRSVFGLFSVPTRWYPFVLMLALQLLLPNVSFLGHLAGIAAGLLHVAGALAYVVPALATLRKIETAWLPAALVRLPAYRLVPAADPLVVVTSMGVEGLVPAIAAAARAAGACLAAAARAATGGAAAVRAAAGGAAGAAAAAAPAAAAGAGAGFRLGSRASAGGSGAEPERAPSGAGGDEEAGGGGGGGGAAAGAAHAGVFASDDVPADAPLLAAGGGGGADAAARADVRAKAAAAAEARAALAASVGRPSARV
jgi:membrane associated rhomboid family serine protease